MSDTKYILPGAVITGHGQTVSIDLVGAKAMVVSHGSSARPDNPPAYGQEDFIALPPTYLDVLKEEDEPGVNKKVQSKVEEKEDNDVSSADEGDDDLSVLENAKLAPTSKAEVSLQYKPHGGPGKIKASIGKGLQVAEGAQFNMKISLGGGWP